MTWSEYKKQCKANNVEPTRADFKGIELTYAQIDARILRSRKQPAQVMAATVGQ